MTVIDRLHNLSIKLLTLCGFGALISLAVNIITALVMLAADSKQRKTDTK